MHAIKTSALVAAAVLGLAASTASATVITFSGLPGTTGDPLAPYTEAGFTVTPTSGNWLEAHAFGNPLPSIYVVDFNSAPFGALAVTHGGDLFSFNSLDLESEPTPSGWELRGSRGGVLVFDLADSRPGGSFNTILSPSSLLIDTLTFDVSAGPGSFNVDNINVELAAAVPEPASFVLLLAGISGLGLARRRR
jgi:hypothetical protein